MVYCHQSIHFRPLKLQMSNDILLVPSSCERDYLKINKSTACGSQHLGVGCVIEGKKSKSKKRGHNSEKKKMHFELSPLIVWITLG